MNKEQQKLTKLWDFGREMGIPLIIHLSFFYWREFP